MDPLAELGRNDRCWCGSHLKYKHCHGDKRPASVAGAPLPPDWPGCRYISPSMSVRTEALTESLSPGTPIYLPPTEPAPSAIAYTNWEHELSKTALKPGEHLDPAVLGKLRVEVLRRVSTLTGDGSPEDNVVEALYRLAAETLRTVDSLSRRRPKPTVLWNEELDVPTFLGRTLLLADHVLVPDDLFAALTRSADLETFRRLAKAQLELSDLISNGLVVFVPRGVAMAHRGPAAQQLTARDLADGRLVDWVRDQLIVEGPTARETLLVSAGDDLSTDPVNFWMYGRVEPGSFDNEAGTFMWGSLQPYDAGHDYAPWMRQVVNSATSMFIQRTNERLVSADVFAAEYVSASMFEARLLRRQGTGTGGVAQSAIWADVPALPDLKSPDLARALLNEAAVADLRDQVRVSVMTARAPGEQVDALTHLAHGLEAASHKLERKMSSDRFWQAISPATLGTAGLFIGGIFGGLPGLVGGGLGAAAGLTPYLGTRLTDRRDAAYLFVAGRRASAR
ncbi:SEC-C domain-containing protein [Solicola sp. PLA-1-18]|uniref:SEC-C domain-containing protein n=1 Tax=Solicola sp. PLA-1-18 TaxID=3380532 RepID=UPI003B81C8D0